MTTCTIQNPGTFYMLYILYIFQVSTEFHIWWKLLVHKVSSGISVVVVTTVTGLDFGYVYLSSQLSILFCFYFSLCTPVGFTSNLSKFPLHIFSATHVPNQFFILSSIYNHVSRQFALVFCFVFSSYASQTFYFILFLLFKFSFLVHIRFLFISCILCVFSYFPHVLVFSGSCVQNWTLCLCFDINSMFGVFVFWL